MKNTIALLTIVIVLILAASVAMFAQSDDNRQMIIKVNSSTNLNVAALRITAGEFLLNPAATNMLTLHVEAWNAQTPRSNIVAKLDVFLSGAELKALFNSPNTTNVLKLAILEAWK